MAKLATIERDYRGPVTVYRLRAGRRGTGRVLRAIRDRGYGREACEHVLRREAEYDGYVVCDTPRED